MHTQSVQTAQACRSTRHHPLPLAWYQLFGFNTMLLWVLTKLQYSTIGLLTAESLSQLGNNDTPTTC